MDKELEAITLAGTSNLPSRKIGGKASARVVKLRNPKIITIENKNRNPRPSVPSERCGAEKSN
jgi:hypothetical protein